MCKEYEEANSINQSKRTIEDSEYTNFQESVIGEEVSESEGGEQPRSKYVLKVELEKDQWDYQKKNSRRLLQWK